MWQWRSQKEFYEHILATGGGKNVLTMPLNEGLLPPPDTAVATADYEDTTGGIGTVTPVLEELNPTWFTTMLEGLHESPANAPSSASLWGSSRASRRADLSTNTTTGLFEPWKRRRPDCPMSR